MRNTAPPPAKSAASEGPLLATSYLPRLIESWLLAGDIASHSERTLSSPQERVGKLVWFLDHKKLPECGLHEMRQFFQYLTHGHKEPGGRWGNPRMTKPTTSGRVKSYHNTLRTSFNWCVNEGEIADSPMKRIPPPVDRPDQIQPFTVEQIKALIAAAKKSPIDPKREEAVLLLLLDTGIRASEFCALDRRDIDLQGAQVPVRHGKGDKARYLPFSRETKRALYNLMNQFKDEPDSAVFLAERGGNAGGRLTRSGLQQIITRLCKEAGLDASSGVRCSPHTFRYTFAIMFLRSGGNVFTLQQMLGHTALSMTNKYVQIAQADMDSQHRRFSPVASLNQTGKRG